MKRKYVIFCLLILIVALSLSYVFISPVETKKIKIVAPPGIIATLPIWIAIEKGFFESESLEVDIVSVSDSKYMVESLLHSDIDVLPAVSLVDLATTGEYGSYRPMARVKIYSHARMKKNPAFESLLVATMSPISTLEDLKDAKIAVYPGVTSELTVRYFFKENNIDVSKMTFVKLPPGEHFSALMRNQVQAVHVYEPYRTLCLENNKTREIMDSIYASMTEPCAIGLSAVSRSFLKKPESERFFKAWDRSIEFIRNNPHESRKILAQRLDIPEEIAKKATWVDATKLDETDFGILKNTFKLFQNANVIPKNLSFEADMVVGK